MNCRGSSGGTGRCWGSYWLMNDLLIKRAKKLTLWWMETPMGTLVAQPSIFKPLRVGNSAPTWCNMKYTVSVVKGSWQQMFNLELTNPWDVNASEQKITRKCIASQHNEGGAGYGGIHSYILEMLINYIPVVMPVTYFKLQQKPRLLQIGQNINHR